MRDWSWWRTALLAACREQGHEKQIALVEGLAACAANASARAEKAEARALELGGAYFCAYCDYRDEVGNVDDILEHVARCEYHPMRKAEIEWDRRHTEMRVRAEKAERERDEARARPAAAGRALKLAYCGGLPTQLNEVESWCSWSEALYYNLAGILSDAPALAVVEATTHHRNDLPPNAADNSLWVNCRVSGKWPGPVTVVVMPARKEG